MAEQRTQYYVASSLDSYIADENESLQWLFDNAGSDAADVGGDDDERPPYEAFMEGVGALAMGSATYEWVLKEISEWPYAQPAWVFTTRGRLEVMGDADIRFVEGSPREHHAAMLESANGKHLWMVGGGRLASDFADDGLLDELILTLVPVVLGGGIPLFARALPKPMRLTQSRTLRRSLLELRYEL